jgi:hypothetical protein
MDATFNLNRELVNLITVLASRCGKDGVPLASGFLWTATTGSIARFLTWVHVAFEYYGGFTFHPDRFTTDDDTAEHNAIRAVFGCIIVRFVPVPWSARLHAVPLTHVHPTCADC